MGPKEKGGSNKKAKALIALKDGRVNIRSISSPHVLRMQIPQADVTEGEIGENLAQDHYPRLKVDADGPLRESPLSTQPQFCVCRA